MSRGSDGASDIWKCKLVLNSPADFNFSLTGLNSVVCHLRFGLYSPQTFFLCDMLLLLCSNLLFFFFYSTVCLRIYPCCHIQTLIILFKMCIVFQYECIIGHLIILPLIDVCRVGFVCFQVLLIQPVSWGHLCTCLCFLRAL